MESPAQTVEVDIHVERIQDGVKELAEEYSRTGVALFNYLGDAELPVHPLLLVGRLLADEVGWRSEVVHPAEREDARDGTVKLYHSPKWLGPAMDSSALAVHQDGFGNAGSVESVGLFVESGGARAATTYFTNLALVVRNLMLDDPTSVEGLFAPDAIHVTSRRGSSSLRTTGPILFLDELDRPAVNFRESDSDTVVSIREDLLDMYHYLLSASRPGASGVLEVQFNQTGTGVFSNNRLLVHGRTAFTDGERQRRVLARKWWSSYAGFERPIKVPGFRVSRLYSEVLNSDRVEGEWIFDEVSGLESRVR
ncbi:TauD/TfdA family dioxygenase [Pseudoclavibacter sp. AY1F1]|uniref:TauD/TfdA family dioxygenase n=1 Tax=Pseudoclavibacter sp. AY1F1 TaxID=2080583 RepID=UPI0015E4363D|nr:TauD/TfdA family dioxygenase [Pseudoclavibacter sp. AY1F1]